MNPGGSSVIASSIALFNKLSEGTDGDLLLDPVELQNIWEEAVAEASLGATDGFYWDEEFGHHLFVPGKLLLMHESWSFVSTAADDVVESSEKTNENGVPPQSPDNKRKNNRKDEEDSKFEFHAMWTDGMNTVLKGFEIGAGNRMVTDHLTTSYDRGLIFLEKSTAAS